MLLFPAVDLRRGRCVRLDAGAQEPPFESDPFRVAEGFARAGAEWIHIVDLDAAFGEGSNRTLIAELARAVPLRVQAGGGLRTEQDLEELLDGPVERAVIGTAGLQRPELVGWAVDRWGADRIAVGLDRGEGRAHATSTECGDQLLQLAREVVAQGARTLVYTASAGENSPLRDIELAAALARGTQAQIVVACAASDSGSLRLVAESSRKHPGIVGAIVGRDAFHLRLGQIDPASPAAAS